MLRWLAGLLIAAASAALAGPAEDFRAGEDAYRSGDLVGAMPLLRRAADAGDARAQALYGHLLDISEFNEQAALYYRQAAEQGNVDGQFGLGSLYAAGEGVERDAAAARRWFELAASQGHAGAINTLARASISGELGFPRGELKWIDKAAEQGYFPALDYLAKGYRSGAFGEVNLARAAELDARIKALGPPPSPTGKRRK
jgi:TPR repeat protein